MDGLRIGVSACLTGANVRFDGGHKQDDFVDQLAAQVELVPVCPEMEVGMGTPREAVRLVRRDDGLVLLGARTGRDWTTPMRTFAEARVERLAALALDGFIVKKDSPSCGLERVRVYEASGRVCREGTGLFTEVLRARLPLLPVEDEGRLRDPGLRESFLVRVFAHRELRLLFARPDWRLGELVALHTRMKLLVLACDPERYRALGRLVAHGRAWSRPALAALYRQELLTALARPVPPARHVNVLQHLAGYFKRQVSAPERQELAELIDDYRQGKAPRAAPLALIQHHIRKQGVHYLAAQVYLRPYPKCFLHG
jgi:uncharacterized protein YbgA (DUF1722 family)/uncharacterized protein YbbK (DUF523 family)